MKDFGEHLTPEHTENRYANFTNLLLNFYITKNVIMNESWKTLCLHLFHEQIEITFV